jgi:hypothetical protein
MAIATRTSIFRAWCNFSLSTRGLPEAQKCTCFFTKPSKWSCASSVNYTLCIVTSSLPSAAKSSLCCLSRAVSLCTTAISYGYKCKSLCKIHCTGSLDWLTDGVRLCLRTAATNEPIVHPPCGMWTWRTMVMMPVGGINPTSSTELSGSPNSRDIWGK